MAMQGTGAKVRVTNDEARTACPGNGGGNATAEAIVARLPDKPLVNAREVADALDLLTARAIADAADEGKIAAVKIGNQYRISRAEAARWIRTLGL